MQNCLLVFKIIKLCYRTEVAKQIHTCTKAKHAYNMLYSTSTTLLNALPEHTQKRCLTHTKNQKQQLEIYDRINSAIY